MSALDFDARINGSQLQADIDGVNRKLKGMTTGIAQEGQNIDDIFKKIGFGIGAYFGIQQIGSFIKQIATVRGEFQDLNTSFETILSSKEKADKLMQQVVQFAATTPFNLKDVASGTKQMLAYGFSAESMIGNLRMLGDVAAGTSTPINDLIYLYGTLQTQGRAYTKDIMQFTGRGIPIIAELAKQMGVAREEVQGMVEAGKVGFPEVEKAFKSMTGASGMFGGLMEKQSKNINGLYSNLVDSIDQAANSIGESNQGAIAGAIKSTTYLVQNYETIGKVLITLVSTYGAYKAATMAAAAAQSVSTIAVQRDLMTREVQIAATIKATWAQSALNKAILANPYAAAFAGLVALISIMVAFSDKAKTAQDYIDEMNKSMEQIGKQIEIDSLISKFDELKNKQVKSKEEQQALNETIQALAAIFPQAISGTDQYGKAIDLVSDKLYANNKALRENLKLATGDEINAAQAELIRKIAERDRLLNEINTGKTKQENTSTFGASANVASSDAFGLSPEQIADRRKQVISLSSEIDGLGKTIEASNKKLVEFSSADAQEFINNHKELFKQVTDYTRQQAYDTRDALVKLYEGAGESEKAAIQKQAQALNDYANGVTTVGERLTKASKDLAEAKTKLAEMKLPQSEATDKQIEDQELLIASLEKTLGIKKSQKEAVDQIKKTEDDLEKAAKARNGSEVARLTKKLDDLNKEKSAIEWIIYLEKLKFSNAAEYTKQQNKIASNQGIDPITTKNPVIGQQKTVKGVAYEITAIDKSGPVWEKVKLKGKGVQDALNKAQQKATKEQYELDEENDKKAKDRKQQQQENLLNYSRQFTSELITQLGLSQEETKTLEGLADTIFNLAKGDYLAAAFSAASLILSLIVEEEKHFSDYYIKIGKNIDDLIKKINLVNEAFKNTGTSNLESLNKLNAFMSDLSYQADTLNKKLNSKPKNPLSEWASVMLGDFGSTEYALNIQIEKFKELDKTINELSIKLLTQNLTAEEKKAIEATIESYNNLKSAIDSSVQNITGTTYADLSNAFIDAFMSGENAAEKWGEKVNDVIKNVIAKQLTAQLLTDPVTKAINVLVKDQENGFTPEEAKKFKEAINSIYTTVAPAYQAAVDALKAQGIDLTNPTGTNAKDPSMTGAVKGIEQNTASLIAGQLMAIRDYQVRGFANGNALLASVNNQTAHLSNISKNSNSLPEMVFQLANMIKILNERL